jgi:hypothetical protein
MKINVEEIIEQERRRREINRLELSEIEWFKDGVKLEVDPEDIEEWRFIGLSNVQFVTSCLFPAEDLGLGISIITLAKKDPA